MKHMVLKSKSAVTLIALVVTIIILLILAGVTIATLTGDNGIISQTQNAKEQTEIAEEKEQMNLAIIKIESKNEENLEKRAEIFQKNLEEYTGEGNNKVYSLGTEYVVHFLKSNRVYSIDENGKIEEEDPIIVKEDSVAGEFEGEGTEEQPYKIMSIEDLVYLANQVNSGSNVYSGQWVALGRPLDFKSKLSYKNVETTYTYDETSNSYIPDESSETTLMELCTTGTGFVPINGYKGSFNGNGYYISNIYENRSGYCGLFGVIGGYYLDARIKNLTIDGEITSTDNYAAGFVGLPNGVTIENCINNVKVYGTEAGGFAGYYRYGSDLIFINCINNGKIIAADMAGGIIGYAYNGKSFTNCINNGEIEGVYAGGIVRLE